MRRRRFLAGIGVGAAASVAGCGYAYGGGDVRASASVPAPGDRGGDHLFAEVDERVATARAGMQWLRDADGDLEYTPGTSVTLATRTGETRWEFTYDQPAEAIAVGDRAYLLTDDGRLVASEPVEATAADDTRRHPVTTTVAWTRDLHGAAPPLAAVGDLVCLSRDDALVGVRDGDVAWEVDAPARVRAIRAAEGAILAVTGRMLRCLGPDGARRWEWPAGASPVLDVHDGRVLLRAGDELALLALASGEPLWTTGVDTGGRAWLGAETAYRTARGVVTAVDAVDGETAWEVHGVAHRDALLVPAADAAYAAGPDGEVVAIDPAGVRWSRDLDLQGAPLAGWLADERVGVIYEHGAIRWLQRRDEGRPLLW